MSTEAIHAHRDTPAEGQPDGTTTQSPLTAPFRLDHWLVEPDLNRISHDREALVRHLEPRLMQLLCYLAANAGQVMTREALVKQLWPRVVVNENSLTRAVSELRKHLKAPGCARAQLIETIPKRGYRLNQQPLAATVATQSTAAHPRAQLGRRWQWAGLSAASLCLLLVTALVQQAPTVGTPLPAPLLADEIVTLDDNAWLADLTANVSTTGETSARAISAPVLDRDGKRFAYISRNLGGYSIYLGDTGSEQDAVAVFQCQSRLSNLTWSPLGDALLFARHQDLSPAAAFANSDSQVELLSLNLETGKVKRLVEDELPSEPRQLPVVNLTAVDKPLPSATQA